MGVGVGVRVGGGGDLSLLGFFNMDSPLLSSEELISILVKEYFNLVIIGR